MFELTAVRRRLGILIPVRFSFPVHIVTSALVDLLAVGDYGFVLSLDSLTS